MKKILLGILYWLVELTWGALLTIPGLLVSLFCIIFLHGKAHRNGFSYIVEVGGNWGGLNLGAVSLCGSYSKDDADFYFFVRTHEFGHSVQTLIFGPFQVFVVSIPSMIRYWYDVYCSNHEKYLDEEWYYSIWFEHTASTWGTKLVDWIEK